MPLNGTLFKYKWYFVFLCPACFSVPHRNFWSLARSPCAVFLSWLNWWFFVIAHGYKCPIHQKSTIVACLSLSSSSFFALFLNAYYLVLWIGFFWQFGIVRFDLYDTLCASVFTWFFWLSLCLCGIVVVVVFYLFVVPLHFALIGQ